MIEENDWYYQRGLAQDEGRFLGNCIANMINTLFSDMTIEEKRTDIADRKDVWEKQVFQLKCRIEEIEGQLASPAGNKP